ncbi:RBBP9/YdeN family alpha/beta hydrolase [Pseudaquabacterium rugosum]|uniref:Alpha/beta hydrolase n=1 Tax=Pseudaquabacterium rugosum TaxID=2984194 RepID=A0ABU9BCU8_9BURK
MGTPAPDCGPPPLRLLIVPGLHDSEAAHWQTWLQHLHRHGHRVRQDDWDAPDLVAWSARIDRTLREAAQAHPGAAWAVAAHSFGVLSFVHAWATARQAPTADSRPAERPGWPAIRGVLLVAPADPRTFGVEALLPRQPLARRALLVGSQTDPWMTVDRAQHWARLWGAEFHNLGDAGHINTASGHGPLPLARRWLMAVEQGLARQRHAGGGAGVGEGEGLPRGL